MAEMTRASIAKRLIEAMTQERIEEAMSLYAEDVHIAVPINIPKAMSVKGKEELREVLLARPRRMYENLRIENLYIHEATDPEVVIAEWVFHSTVGDPAEVVTSANVIVLRIRDGKIIEARDYHDDVQRARANGLLPDLIEEIEALSTP